MFDRRDPGQRLRSVLKRALRRIARPPQELPAFFVAASNVIRGILVDFARQRVPAENEDSSILAVDAALTRLSQFDQRQASVAEMRYFGGLTEEEIAEALKVSPREVKRAGASARAGLHKELKADIARWNSAAQRSTLTKTPGQGDSMKRAILAGVMGGIAMFVWASVAHMALPLGGTGISEIPGETAVLGAMRSAMGDTAGMYMFPAMGLGPNATMSQKNAAMATYDQKLAVNPSGMLIYRPPGARSMEPSQLTLEFLTETLEAVIAVFLLMQTRIYTFSGRVLFFTVVGVLCSLGTNVSYWNWYGFPGSYTAAYMAIQIVEFVVAGLVAAAVLRKKTP